MEGPAETAGDPFEWTHERRRAISRATHILVYGAGIGIIGLVFALSMAIFREQCQLNATPGKFVSGSDTTYMCKDASHMRKVNPEDIGIDNLLGGVAIRVHGTPCHNDGDCKDLGRGSFDAPGFCVGGPDKFFVEGYCKDNDCECHSMVFDCGTKHYVEYNFLPSNFTTGCTKPRCSRELALDIHLWTFDVDLFGCNRKRKTSIYDIMVGMQKRMQGAGLLTPMKPESDPVYDSLRASLARVPDVQFGGFWPSTISESVSNAMSPAGRIFMGVMMCAALCLFVSEYTFEFPSVDLPTRHLFGMMSWNTLRNLFPPIGLILLAVVPMKPTSEIFDFTDVLMTAVHLIGAQLCFIVYLACEFMCLHDKENLKDMAPGEQRKRMILFWVGAVAMTIFATVYGVLLLFVGDFNNPYVQWPFTGHSDMYEVSELEKESYLVRAASGFWKFLKVLSYTAEYIVAMAILVSHVVICQERFKELASLEEEYSEEEELSEEEAFTRDYAKFQLTS